MIVLPVFHLLKITFKLTVMPVLVAAGVAAVAGVGVVLPPVGKSPPVTLPGMLSDESTCNATLARRYLSFVIQISSVVFVLAPMPNVEEIAVAVAETPGVPLAAAVFTVPVMCHESWPLMDSDPTTVGFLMES